MSSQRPKVKIIISGGGTGGHIFPAVSIAQSLLRFNPDNEVLFVGAKGRMEMEKVPAAGFRIIGLNIAGLQRKFTLSNFALPFKVADSLLSARRIIRDFKPDAAVGVGGYASGPLLFAASLHGIPCLIQEQNSYAGVTNRLLSRIVSRICVAYPGMEHYFPKAKIRLTGNPVRNDLHGLGEKRNEALNHFKLEAGKPVLLVIGGSLGARTVNEAIGAGLSRFVKEGIQVIWQTGKSGFEASQSVAKGAENSGIRVFDFIQRMDLAYAAADVVVSRAGASSVSEMAVAAKPSILVPSPNVAEDHQTKNAMALVGRGAALMVKDAEARSCLVDESISLLKDIDRREGLASHIRALAMPDAADTIAEEVYGLISEKKR
jgi:UDP-N-acetylglucosamine--N-acetylmuramyl-(pentapeptide) pyrophosphoryl-undecaprenol N-acetylglucosamine transferase